MLRLNVLSMLALAVFASNSASANHPTTGTLTQHQAQCFRLADQYGNDHSINYPQEKVCVLVFADERGSTQVEGWVRPLYERYETAILIFGVAELSNVPERLRSTIRGIFRRSVKYPVMLDWTGRVSGEYGYAGKSAAVVIVSPQGVILHRETGKANRPALNRSFAVVDGLVRQDGLLPPETPQNDDGAMQQTKERSGENRAADAL